MIFPGSNQDSGTDLLHCEMMISYRPSVDREFAKALTKANMGEYYKKYNIDWDDERFNSSWDQLENFDIAKDERRVGVLRLSRKSNALQIRDLQILKEHQNCGLGTHAIQYATRLAKARNLPLIKLNVFQCSPAVALYERLGFQLTNKQGNVVQMACVVT